jgi:hypothetical protein
MITVAKDIRPYPLPKKNRWNIREKKNPLIIADSGFFIHPYI